MSKQKTQLPEKLETIPITQIPPRKKTTKWYEFFGKIPKKDAVVLTEEQVNFSYLRALLAQFQKKEQFTDIVVTVRSGKAYIYREAPEKVEKKPETQ